MRKILSCVAILFGLILSTITFADTLDLYENPDENSRIVATIKIENDLKLTQIDCTDNKDWIMLNVRSPKKNESGWAQTSELERLSMRLEADRLRALHDPNWVIAELLSGDHPKDSNWNFMQQFFLGKGFGYKEIFGINDCYHPMPIPKYGKDEL